KVLVQRQQRIFLQRRRFEGVIELGPGRRQVRGLEQFNKLSRAAGPAVERRGEARQLPIRPGRGNAEAGMDQQKRGATQGRECRQGNNFLAAPGGERRLGLQKKWNVGAERRRDRLQLFRRQGFPQKLV